MTSVSSVGYFWQARIPAAQLFSLISVPALNLHPLVSNLHKTLSLSLPFHNPIFFPWNHLWFSALSSHTESQQLDPRGLSHTVRTLNFLYLHLPGCPILLAVSLPLPFLSSDLSTFLAHSQRGETWSPLEGSRAPCRKVRWSALFSSRERAGGQKTEIQREKHKVEMVR